MEAHDPSPQTTLLILLGASEWPQFPEFQSSKAFANAARRLKAYFLNPQPFGLPAENLLDLFDSEKDADELDVEISQFLERRLIDMKKAGHPARDLLLYFIGHAGFIGRDADLYLAVRHTRMDNPRASGYPMLALADALTEKARHLRRIIILDCCFAAAAFAAFQAGPAQLAIEKTNDAFEVGHRGEGFPTKGTTLLCSSGHKAPSLLLPDGSSTMFTKAFLEILVQGTTPQRDRLSLRNVKDLAADVLSEIRNAPRPVVLSPDQSEGDVADIPFFPNPRAQEEQTRPIEEESRLTEGIIPATLPGSPVHGRSKRSKLLILSLITTVCLIIISSLVIRSIGNTTTTKNATVTPIARVTVTAKGQVTATGETITYPSYLPGKGTLTLFDPLNDKNTSKWGTGPSTATTACRQFKNGAYHVSQLSLGNSIIMNCEPPETFSNFAFEVQMRIIQGNCDGMIFRNKEAFSYLFKICQDGTYAVSTVGSPFDVLLQGNSSAIKTGQNQTNKIAVVAMGATLTFFANEQRIGQVQDSHNLNGLIGLVALSGTEAAYNNAKVWTL